jgi:DNA-binding transcriptional LysR family regulator
MEFHQLKHFVAAAESESFTRGAERAFVSQPALSASISKLEEELGAQLFIRNKRSVVLTPAGRKLLKRARLIMAECAQAKAELKHHDEQRSLRLGVINTLSIRKVANLIEQYCREAPGVLLDVTDAGQDQIEKYQKEARIDFALTLLGEGKRKKCRQELLFSEPYVIALPLGHHLSGRRNVSLSELAREPFVARTHCESRSFLGELLKGKGVRLHVVYKTNQDDRAISLVEAGVGIAIIPRHYCCSSISTLGLVEMQTERKIGFEWSSDSNLDEIRKFVDFAKTVPWSS